VAVPRRILRMRAASSRRRGRTLGELITSGSPEDVRTACKDIHCAGTRVCYCAAFIVPPDCWCDDVIVYPDGSTSAPPGSIKELPRSPSRPIPKRKSGPKKLPTRMPKKKSNPGRSY